MTAPNSFTRSPAPFRLTVHVFCGVTIALLLAANVTAQVDANASAPAVKVDADGTVHIPPQTVPLSSFLSPEARAYVTYRLLHPDPAPDPDITKERARIDAHLAPLIDKQKARYPVEIQPATIAGVSALVIVPKAGIAPRNLHRVLINLHGGGFSVCVPTCGIIESIPIAGLGKIKVVTVNYRQGPEFKFPAASEDVAKVYAELLKQYKPESIGIFGCSAGGMLTAESVAWFQTHHLPRPGAIGIFCASAGDFGGDAEFTTPPLDGRMPPPPNAGDGRMHLGYFSEANMRDPMISPVESAEVLRQFPPTLILSGTRAFDYSSGINTHNQLTKLGVGGWPARPLPTTKNPLRVPHPGRFCPGGSFDLSAHRGGLGRLVKGPGVGFNRRHTSARAWALANRSVLAFATNG